MSLGASATFGQEESQLDIYLVVFRGFLWKIGSKIGWKIGSPHPILDPILQRPTRIRVNPPDFKTGWVKIGSKIGWVRNPK